MDIFVFSDESGVFDKKHQQYFVYGGIIFLNKEDKDKYSRQYHKAENDIRKSGKYASGIELKASIISNHEKGKLFRSVNQCIKFGAIIDQTKVLDQIFTSTKDKQRFLDYAYKIALKRAFQHLISEKKLIPSEVSNIRCWVDEHTTKTNGKYELEESLEQEFKSGTYNFNYSIYYKPIFPDLNSIQVDFCDSKTVTLIRSADIIANKIYYLVRTNKKDKLNQIQNLYLTYLP